MAATTQRLDRRVSRSQWQQCVARFGERKARDILRANRPEWWRRPRASPATDGFSLIHRLVHAAMTTAETAIERRKKLSPIIRDILWVAREHRVLSQ